MGNIYSFYNEGFPPKSAFSVDDIPDLSGRVIIVTGANTAYPSKLRTLITYLLTQALLVHNAKVYIAARSKDKAEAAIEDLKKDTGKEAIFLKVDLADLQSIKAGAEEFLRGVMAPPVELITQQGYDLQFGTNVLGHFYLTKLLLPALLAGAQSSPDGKARVVNTSSSGHMLGKLDFNTFKDSPKRKKTTPFTLYSQSKFGNVVFSNELARRYGNQGIVSTSLNPGNLRTDLQRHTPTFLDMLLGLILHPAPYGALTQLYAGTSAAGAEFNGKYLIPWARVGEAVPATQDPELAKQLWEWAEEQVANV
ncbi:hypothetical protein C0991_010296 [Blastosporella zonata]|nr:hypothetical protein C0991_010296 [Blastosporella zonata]